MSPLASMNLADASQLLMLPVVIIALTILLFIPSIGLSGAPNPEAIGRAVVCYLMKGFALVFMGVSGLLATYNLMNTTILSREALASIILVFAVGLGLFVHFNRIVSAIDASAVAVPKAIFRTVCIVLGLILACLSIVSLALTVLLTGKLTGWQMPASVALLSVILALSFSLDTSSMQRVFARKKK